MTQSSRVAPATADVGELFGDQQDNIEGLKRLRSLQFTLLEQMDELIGDSYDTMGKFDNMIDGIAQRHVSSVAWVVGSN